MNLFKLAKPLVFAVPPERAHDLTIKALKSGMLPSCKPVNDPRLAVNIGGLTFPNPVGLAAGFDKNGEVPDAILKMGFGFTEVGTVTPRAQAGNPKPRLFRLVEDESVINRLGFNNQGHGAVLRRLEARKNRGGIVGVNIGANKDSDDFVADYEAGIDAFYGVASYFTANISSPNTPGLRNLQAKDALKTLLERIFNRVEKCAAEQGKTIPVFLKIAPDITQTEMDEIAEVVLQSPLAALIVSNTTLSREGLKNQTLAQEAGGLSGKMLFAKSTEALSQMHQRLGTAMPLIGVGGIASARDAIEKLKAGASLIQLYTALVYKGPNLANEIVKGLSRHADEVSS